MVEKDCIKCNIIHGVKNMRFCVAIVAAGSTFVGCISTNTRQVWTNQRPIDSFTFKFICCCNNFETKSTGESYWHAHKCKLAPWQRSSVFFLVVGITLTLVDLCRIQMRIQ